MSSKTIFLSIFFVILFAPFVQAKQTDSIVCDTSYCTINKIIIIGNKKTKKNVVLKELLFSLGDTIHTQNLNEVLKKSKESLLNTSLFNYVTINTTDEKYNLKNVYIILEERWYLWPNIILEHADRNLSAFLHQSDWSKINYGIMLTKYNFRGRREKLKIKFRKGYKEQIELYYAVPFLFDTKKHGFSAKFSWFRQNESSVYNRSNKQVFYKETDNYVLKYYEGELLYRFRSRHYKHHHLGVLYTKASVKDTIIKLNPRFFDFGKNSTHYISLNYIFSIDKRNYRHYPLSGYYAEFNAKQQGLGLLNNEKSGVYELSFTYNYFYNFAKRWYGGVGSKVKTSTNKKQPYFTERALGHKDFLRSYEYYVINGQHFCMGRTFLKYEVLPTKITTLNFLKWDKFNKIHYSIYSNIFFDSAYSWDIMPGNNNLANTFLYGMGVGVDLVAYYDQVIRFEYSVNKNLEHGFFLHIGKAF